ncbi:MAG: hypothetical protein ACYCX2_09640 [Christensenellales bacterium]
MKKQINWLSIICISITVFMLCLFSNTRGAKAESLIEDYDRTVIVLAKVLYGEARGVKSITNKASVVWCVLNRVDNTQEFKRDTTPIKAATRRHQFAYRSRYPATPENIAIVKDVLARWELEKQGVEDVGRVLPKEFTFFCGKGNYNLFRDQYRGGTKITQLHSAIYGD